MLLCGYYAAVIVSWAISNDKLLNLITDLTSKVNSLTDIVKYQTNLIQELKADNTQITNLINTEFKNNKDTLGELKHLKT